MRKHPFLGIKAISPLLGNFIDPMYIPSSGDSPVDENTLLFVRSNNEDGDTTFVDSSTYEHVLSSDIARVDHSTDQAKFGTSSIHFHTLGGYISAPAHADFYFSTDDFTIDFWLFFGVGAGFQYKTLASCRLQDNSTGWQLLLDTGTNTDPTTLEMKIEMQTTVGYRSTTAPADSFSDLSSNDWHHLAVERYDGAMYFYKDGTMYHSDTSSVWSEEIYVAATAPLRIAHNNNWGSWCTQSFFDEFRVSNVGRYQGQDFTPPTSATY